ncbi:MAG: thioredoxin family protein [Actinomycetes bacterium]
MDRLLVLCAALALAAGVGWWLRRPGRGLAHAQRGAGADAAPTLSPADLDHPLGSRATLVQFSTAFCQPCRATRVILTDVSGQVPGVVHVEVDAESNLDLVRRLDVRRTPTVLVLDGDGRVVRRASGQPRKADVIAALGTVVSA